VHWAVEGTEDEPAIRTAVHVRYSPLHKELSWPKLRQVHSRSCRRSECEFHIHNGRTHHLRLCVGRMHNATPSLRSISQQHRGPSHNSASNLAGVHSTQWFTHCSFRGLRASIAELDESEPDGGPVHGIGALHAAGNLQHVPTGGGPGGTIRFGILGVLWERGRRVGSSTWCVRVGLRVAHLSTLITVPHAP
jgi:hypothetical protein